MYRKIATLFALAVVAPGCATVKEGLVGDEHEDIGPFAESTVELMTLSKLEFRKSELIYLRQHAEANEAEVERLRDVLRRIDGYRDDVMRYSIELVRISDSHPTDAAKCADLAGSVEARASGRFLSDQNLTDAEYRAAADTLREMTNFLACLRVLQPLIVRSAESFHALASEAEDEVLPETVRSLDRSINAAFATVLTQLDVVYERRDELFHGLQMIRAYRKGDRDALRDFNAETVLAGSGYALPASPTEAQLERTKDHLIGQLQKEDLILGFLEIDRNDYVATHAELDREEQEILDGLELARRQVNAWVTAHQALADGVRNPGKWLKGVMKFASTFRK